MSLLDNHSREIYEATPNETADILIRYSHNEEYSESELESLFLASAHHPPHIASVEVIFLDRHIDYVWQKCTSKFEQLKATSCDMPAQITAISRMWSEIVFPTSLTEINILGAEAVESLRITFATLIRVFLNVPVLVDWLVQETCETELNRAPENTAKSFIYHMNTYGLYEECNTFLSRVIPVRIDQYVSNTWAQRYSNNVPSAVQAWVEHTLVPQIREIISSGGSSDSAHTNVPMREIQRMALVALGKLRIRELFDIVEQQQMDGIEDLHRALTSNHSLRNDTVTCFIEQCDRRLLNGASDTVDIIAMYMKTIHSFSILDPQGILLQKVSSKIRLVLRERTDTCAKLAEGLFGVASSPLAYLAKDLKKNTQPRTKFSALQSFKQWVPDPIDTPVDFVRKQTNDTVSTLINLFDNKEVFVQQLVILYGAELLNIPLDDTRALDQLEEHFHLLCLRFGESNMHKINVMVQDVRQSHAIAQQIHKRAPQLHNISALILSRLYWPSILRSSKSLKASQDQRGSQGMNHSTNQNPNQQFKVPHRFKKMVDEYAEIYNQLPGQEMLGLEWLPDRGRVSISLELQDRTLDMVVQPDQAVLISVFEGENGGKSALTLAELMTATEFKEQQLLNAIQFWIDHDVLGTEGEKYRVLETVEEVEAQGKTQAHIVVPENSTQTNSNKVTDPFEDMHAYWSYIVGMLTNLGTLTLERIHSFLVMFVPNEDPYVKTKQELESYLLAMVDEGKLKYEDSKYSLVKK